MRGIAPPPHPIRSVDFYQMESGELGIAWVSRGGNTAAEYMSLLDPDPTPGAINLQTADEYLEARYGRGKGSSKPIDEWYSALGFVRPDEAPWSLPDEPSTSLAEWEKMSEGGDLLTELAQYVSEHVRLPEDTSARTIAAWILASSIPEIATHAPPLAFLGPPKSGKSRALRVLRQTARRAMYFGVPSPASLYAIADIYAPVLLVDEWGRLPPDIRRAVESVMRMGFDRGGVIPRRREHSEGVKFWKAFAFFGLASSEPLADDLMDRAIPMYMREAHDVPDLPQEDPRGRELRTMVHRYRLEVLAARSPRQPVIDGRTRVSAELAGRRLSDRGLDKAQVLAAVAAPFDGVDDVVAAILRAEELGRAQYGESIEALIYRSIKALLPDHPVLIDGAPRISLRHVHDQVWLELQELGTPLKTLELRDPVPAEKLGPLVRMMGFETIRTKTGIELRDPDVRQKLEGLRSKYGGGEEEEAEGEPDGDREEGSP